MKKKEKYALVLAGGGAKGAYQIGAWKAFNELGLEICAVAGASVGALNATLFAQNNYERALELWENISLDKVVTLPPDLIIDGKFHIRKFGFLHLREINKSILKYGGLDSTPLQNLINNYVDENSIRKSNIDLGLVTVNVNRLKPVEIFLDNIPEGQLSDYLLASASFPAFKQATIDGKNYTDGGIYDNIPYKMIKERGYKKIIIVDIAGPGFNRKPDIEGTQTIYIKNTSDIGSVLNFDQNILKELLNLGYLDTMKTFGKIDGNKYFINANSKIEDQLERIISNNLEIRKMLPKSMRLYHKISLSFLECAASVLGIEKSNRYDISDLLKEIETSYYEIVTSSEKKGRHHYISDFKSMRRIMKKRYGKREIFKYPPFEYYHILNRVLDGKKLHAAEKTLNLFFPSLPAGLFFIDKVIKNKDKKLV